MTNSLSIVGPFWPFFAFKFIGFSVHEGIISSLGLQNNDTFNCYLGDPVPLAMTVSAEDSPANVFDCKDKEDPEFKQKRNARMYIFTAYVHLNDLHFLHK